MHKERYNKNDAHLIETMMGIGLSQYKIHKLLCTANEKEISLQKAYRLTEANILNVDVIILAILFFYISIIMYLDPDSLFTMVFIIILVFIVLEMTCRFHKNFYSMLKIYIKLRGL